MTPTQFNAIYTSLDTQGIRHCVCTNDNTVKAMRTRGWIDKYYTVTFTGLCAALEAILQSKRSDSIKQLELIRISTALANYKLS